MSETSRRTFAVDLDGTLCENALFWRGEEGEPKQEVIDLVNELYDAGNVIIINTSRREEDRPMTVKWLSEHGVKYHAMVMEKVKADYYIDDKALNVEDVWKLKKTQEKS